MNYKPMFEFASGDSLGNAQVFATKEEALGSAQNRFRVWTMPTGYSADETSDAVTYRWTAETGDASLPILEAV